MTNIRTDADRALLDRFGYIDRRDQSRLNPEDRHAPIPADQRPGAWRQPARGARTSSAPRSITSLRAETLTEARTWERVKNQYVFDGFCCRCSVQAAYGHQTGFTEVSAVCDNCRGKCPTYRWAGARAHRWAGCQRLPASGQDRRRPANTGSCASVGAA